ncbi:NAD(P)-dependent oxidoreductase [Bordetella genomosp. 9]|uniref:6-phosphogluconate dehydrogenase n=1 Tax=Bordetella genomosp. 9 TaxID=1416803 RepID=A0A1W6Z3B5_9BORD|nr:NAD(P)-binding domain-containing protein [Bordetella genomosp. 9]ARP87867.1 6-phosphogluconate dehydrogenase [Bordetella genomosp. 9]ARP91824.1 6-phosphogluconate dehydrogenase [Bordetella genomosp. 9]
MKISKVAVYGLGNMGFLVAERIAAARFVTKVADLDKSAVQRAQDAFQAVPINGPDDVADVDVVVLSLPSPAISLAVLEQIAARLPKHAVVVETSTVNPKDIHASKKMLDRFGLRIVDASVMAGVSQMKAGTAMLLMGGDQAAVKDSQPVLDAIAPKQIYFGESGAGAAAKVINNAVAHAVMVVVAEAGSLATASGVSVEKLVSLLSDPQMGLHRPLTHRYAERIVQGNYEGGMPLDAARKDSVLALELAQTLGVPLFAIQGAHTVYEVAAAAGYGRDDYAAIAKVWADWGKPAVPAAA